MQIRKIILSVDIFSNSQKPHERTVKLESIFHEGCLMSNSLPCQIAALYRFFVPKMKQNIPCSEVMEIGQTHLPISQQDDEAHPVDSSVMKVNCNDQKVNLE